MKSLFQKVYKINFLAIISSPWILSLIPAAVIIFLLPEMFTPYHLTLKKAEDITQNKRLTFFEDLDQNGIKEKIDVLDYRGKFACCFIWGNNNSVKHQFNFYGKIPEQENLTMPVFCDINKDGNREVFVFTQKQDSLFINAVDFSSKRVILNGRFISKIGMVPGVKDFVLRPIINHDYNGDGIPEIYFLLNGCYSLYPRKIMAYDYVNDTLISTINTGSQHFVTPVLTPDDSLILISTTPATNNCPDDFVYSYPDTCARIFTFNDKLELVSKPIEYSGSGCVVRGPIEFNKHLQYVVFNENNSNTNYIVTTDIEGKIINKKTVQQEVNGGGLVSISLNSNHHFLLRNKGEDLFHIYEYKPKLTAFQQSSFTEKLPNSSLIPFELSNGKLAYLSNDYKTNKVNLYIEQINHELSFESDLYFNSYNLYVQSKIIEQGEILKVTDRHFLYTYLITTNNYYSIRYILWGIIYLLSTGFILLILNLYKRQVNKRNKLLQEIVSLQLKLVTAQLDPHFAFNALNLVSAKILKGDKYEAYDLMTCFSSMMRSAMSFSEVVSWSLEKEMQFVTDYLKLMKVRFKDLFDYTIDYDKAIDLGKVDISRLLIQNSVENAIKHAFKNISYKGLVSIVIIQKLDTITVTVTDNGIGREKAMQNEVANNRSGGNGIKWTRKQVEIYNKLFKTHIDFQIEDKLPSGTQIIISIPYKK
ncbi:histidine kinase [Plebeiibacterium sediminum]|uniref:Histidine kinase n=1 Tax=Plebeiibacterium sediminum TaxID=2992112 RepID=A0AAE3M628_9BACT|nr:histidine kinase [Plebeiobacterium sediminum]MCW3787804.1 histidine kinase [Plebeiobacterium sediminum]